MKNYKLILLARHPETGELDYQVTCNDEIIIANCTYQVGYSAVAKLIKKGDSFQEIEGEWKSAKVGKHEVNTGNFIMNGLAENPISKSKKYILLFFTLLPVFYFLYEIFYYWNLSLVEITRLPLAVVFLHIVIMMILIILIAIYTLHLNKNSNIEAQMKIFWVLGFFFTGGILMLYYWRKYIL